MSLIDTTYFVRDINLPAAMIAANDDRQTFIDIYEPKILDKALGYELSQLVQAYNAGSAQRIKDIVEGKAYTVSYNGRDQTIKWVGLTNTAKSSLIAYYVYCYYMRDKITHTSHLGELQASAENAVAASARLKIQRAWVTMREMYGYLGQPDIEASLYAFLQENESDYPEWIWTDIGSMNSFDL